MGRTDGGITRAILWLAIAALLAQIEWSATTLNAGRSGSSGDTIISTSVMGSGMSITGFVTAQGTTLYANGVPIQLFGVNDDMGFVYTYWKDYGRNYNFPTFDGRISGVSSADQFWQQYFRYFLHYQQKVAGSSCSSSACNPNPNLLRLTVGWDFGSEDSYDAWKNDPAGYFANFDALVKWAKAAGVYLVPMLMLSPNDRSFMWEYFDTSSSRYAHLVQFERAMMSKYANEPTIAIWDVYNEADVSLPYWPDHGGFSSFKAWEQRLVNDVRSATTQLITLGHAMTSAYYFFPNDAQVSGYDQTWYNAFTSIQGVDVTHIHVYGTAEGSSNVYLIDWLAQWAKAVGKPMFIGELGYNQYPGPGPVSYGHWPWYLQNWRNEDGGKSVGPVAEMTWVDNGRGAYSDYEYTGSLPTYPSGGAFDFTLSLSSGSGSAAQGGSVSTTGTATLTSGTTHAVTFSASGLPSGATVSFSSTSCSPTCSSTMTITTASTTPAGTYNVVVSATDGTLTRTTGYALTVSVPAVCSPISYPSTTWQRVWYDAALTTCLGDGPDEPNVQFDNNWALGAVAKGRVDDIGFRSSRTINLPTAGTYTFSAGSDDGIRIWIDGTLALDRWAVRAYAIDSFSQSLTAGNHQFKIDFYEGVLQAEVSFKYTAPASGFDFSLSLNPTSGSVAPGSSASTTVAATLMSGTPQAVALSVSGLPSGATASFGSASCTPTCSSLLTVSTSSATPGGSYNIVVAGTGGGVTRTALYQLTISTAASPCPSTPPSYPSASWDRVWCDSTLTSKLADAPDQAVEQFDDNWDLGIVAGIRNSDLAFRSGRTLSLNAATYTFTVGSDDGSRLWVDGTICLDMWVNQAYTEASCSRTFSSTGSHAVRIDYYEGTWNGDGGQARVRFAYSGGTTDTTPPTVGTIDPTTAMVGTPTSFSATANDNVAVSSCAFSWDNVAQGAMAQSGTTFSRTFTPTGTGTHMAGVSCADVSGNAGTRSTSVTVSSAGPTVDTVPPATITDLTVLSVGPNSVTLRWTAPGDDGMTGQAMWYDLRYTRRGAITATNFDGTRHYQIPFPGPAGSIEVVTIYGLRAATQFWFAVRAADEGPVWSAVSNSPSALTPATSGACMFCPLDGIDAVLGTDGFAGDILLALVFVAASGGIMLPSAIRRRRGLDPQRRPGLGPTPSRRPAPQPR